MNYVGEKWGKEAVAEFVLHIKARQPNLWVISKT